MWVCRKSPQINRKGDLSNFFSWYCEAQNEMPGVSVGISGSRKRWDLCRVRHLSPVLQTVLKSVFWNFLSCGIGSFRIALFCSVTRVKGKVWLEHCRLERVLLEVYRGSKKEGKKGNKDCFSLLKVYGYTGFEIHHQVEKSERPREMILFIWLGLLLTL